jgi:hypothetical protein
MPLPAILAPAALKALPWKGIGIGVGVVALVGVIWWRIDAYGDNREAAGEARIKAQWIESANRWKAYTEKLGADYRARTAGLQATADTLRSEKDQSDARNRADIERLAGELRRERNRRPVGLVSTAPTATSAGRAGTCTLRDVYADDAEWLVRYAGATESLNNQLVQCRALYNRARATLNGANP